MEFDASGRDRQRLGPVAGAFVECYVVSTGTPEKDFVSWGACLGDMVRAMELRHLRYFIAVAEEGSLTLPAGKRRYTAPPFLPRPNPHISNQHVVQLLSPR